jgi:CRP-like cAMP-binding protein
MNDFIEFLNQFYPLKDPIVSEFKNYLEIRDVPKNCTLLKKNTVSKELFWVKKGTLRGYIDNEGSTITTWFAIENDVATSVTSFISQQPSTECIETLEDCQLYVISYTHLQQLYQVSLAFNFIGRILTEHNYINLEKRAFQLQNTTAEDRYKAFMKRYPQLLLKLPLSIIASYIGITQSSLSRIRKK